MEKREEKPIQFSDLPVITMLATFKLDDCVTEAAPKLIGMLAGYGQEIAAAVWKQRQGKPNEGEFAKDVWGFAEMFIKTPPSSIWSGMRSPRPPSPQPN